ncbi:magnesium transporter [Paenibacillus planticolens]|uniref:Magnesium transporter MgtE n=1 Tax=Paenibacillus planticolens TaxID=2654976 RepID=A0ABX1ZKU4_9BACL|nr:magnesium transporter [Paenibacillus planticolens]NOU99629.1 magnesium transporter [Paenibacillus planticolens]
MIQLEELKSKLMDSDDNSLITYVELFRPFDLANGVEKLEKADQFKLMGRVPPKLSAEILEYLDPIVQYRILNHFEETITSQVLNMMSSDVVADMMLAIHRYQAEKLLNHLPENYRKKIQTLMTFPEDTAGSLATVDYIAARSWWTIEQTLTHIRKIGHKAEITSYVYVTGHKGELLGVVSLKELILAEPKTEISEIVTKDVIYVPASMEQEAAAELLSRYDLVALPVIDEQNRLVGVITVDDLIDVIHEEATEDIQKLGGSQPLTDTYFKSSVFQLYRKRIVWLLVLFVAEAYTGTVLRHYEETLSEVIALAFFIPLLIGTGGNTGTQTVSTLVRALAVGEVQFRDILKVIRKEVTTGLMTGVSISLIACARAWFLGVEWNIGLVVGITSLTIVLWASFVAAVLPLILHKLKADPAVISGPFITTLVDGTGLIIYFTIAKIILHL